MNIVLAATADPTAPGWGKFLAMVAAIGGVWLAFSIRDRIRRVKAGEEIDPFSQDVDPDGETVNMQVNTPTEGAEKGSRKGSGKWLRRG